MRPHVCMCAVFDLFGALGAVGAKGGNTMNRNPLPRGRAAENVDWTTELFKFLAPSSSSIGVASVRVPLTLVFRHSRPHTWYASSKRAGVTEAPTSGDSDEIIARFVNQATENAMSLGLDGQVDVVAMYVCTVKTPDKSAPLRSRTRIEYFDEGVGLRRVLGARHIAAARRHCAQRRAASGSSQVRRGGQKQNRASRESAAGRELRECGHTVL